MRMKDHQSLTPYGDENYRDEYFVPTKEPKIIIKFIIRLNHMDHE